MSNKSGTSKQVISLPTGGGAVQGIGETFSPDLFSGTGNYAIPITSPPGRNGFQPELSLVYSTGQGNGPFGLGWDVVIPSVSRKTSNGVPRYRDDSADQGENDTFILSGAEDLVPLGETAPGVAQFRPRTEGLFARIERVKDTADDFWRVSSKDGLVSHYGIAASAGGDPAFIADPGDPSKIFSWKLVRTADPFGNVIEYTYLRDRGQDGPHDWDQLYLEQVRYLDFEENGATKFLVTIDFVYEERPDPFSTYRSAFEMRTRVRCTRIQVRTHAAETKLVRTYELSYVDDRVDTGELADSNLPVNSVSLLSKVSVIGHGDDGEQERLPPLEFGYTQFDPLQRSIQPLSALNNALPEKSLGKDDFEMVDLFGDGLPDIVQMNGSVQFWRNLGGGVFDLPTTMNEVPAGTQLTQPGVRLCDLNGNARSDLLVSDLGGYFPLSFQGRWSDQGFVRYANVPSVDFGSPELRLMDLDGDGVVDALRTGTDFELFFSDPESGWSDVELRPRQPIDRFPDLNFSDPQMKLGDMSGDRLQDIIHVDRGRIDYWPYLGHGEWGSRITMDNAPVIDDPLAPGLGFEPRRLHFGDLDGDGLDDLLYVESGKITLCINQSGNRWSDPIVIPGTPAISGDPDDVRLADMLGNGTWGVLWTADRSAPADRNYRFMDLSGGVNPYLLNVMDNNMGAVTRLGYAPSTKFYLDDLGDPQTRWKTPLPSPIQVVERVEVIDEISKGKITTEYRYHHGYWDGAEREFRGFGRVEQFDTESFDRFNSAGLHEEAREFQPIEQRQFSPPTLTKSWFHLGPIGDEFSERLEADFSDEYWPGDGVKLARPPQVAQLLQNLPFTHRADAFRSMRGMLLRTELYALDGTPLEARPYTVTETLIGLREESAPADPLSDRQRVFFPHPRAQRTTQWERGDDPMSQFTFSDNYDAFGNVQTQITIACPRGWREMDDKMPEETPFLASVVETSFASSVAQDIFIEDRVAQTTTSEPKHQGDKTLAEIKSELADPDALDVIGQTLNHYDGEAFSGLPLGQVGRFGALVRSESLVLTEALLDDMYKSGDAVSSPAEKPPYFVPGSPTPWTDEYPQAFRDRMTELAGYAFHAGNQAQARGYYRTTNRSRFDFHDAGSVRGNVLTSKDALGRDSSIEYDDFDFLPTQITDSIGLVNNTSYNYRVFQPSLSVDPNGNRTQFNYSPLGYLASVAVLGKAGQNEGDTVEEPGIRYEYDLTAFMDSQPDAPQPISVRTTQREFHINDAQAPSDRRNDTITTVEYTDGFGRLTQSRTQAQDLQYGDETFGTGIIPADLATPPGPSRGRRRAAGDEENVIVSGWQFYNNKGQVVEKYEPFYAKGFSYSQPSETQLGKKTTSFFDPRGIAIRTISPDGSETRIVLGVPVDLANPDDFAPTPWERYTYDGNDNAASFQGAHNVPASHFNTPSSTEIDSLGRTVRSVARNGPAADDQFNTLLTYDIRGNLLSITDPRGQVALRYTYDMTFSEESGSQPWRLESTDAGLRRLVFNASGAEVERRDAKGSVTLQAYDAINRPTHLWARDVADLPLTLRQHLVYGDSAGLAAPQNDNLVGALFQHFDEAGRVQILSYDFKGNPLAQRRQVIRDEEILKVMGDPDMKHFQVDWETADRDALLDPQSFQTDTAYDALSRKRSIICPEDVDGDRKVIQPLYNRAGLLKSVNLSSTAAGGSPDVFVQHIAYNAKGQRTILALGNGLMCRYEYDPDTFRMVRNRTEKYRIDNDIDFVPINGLMQDTGYEYDLFGNLTKIEDRSPGSGILNSALGQDAFDRTFAYDALYRLISATGREHISRNPSNEPWLQGLRHTTQDPTATRAYRREYEYDKSGNPIRLRHVTANSVSNFTRAYTPAADNNHLDKLEQSGATHNYQYDPNGNMTHETNSRRMYWNHSDKLHAFRIENGVVSLEARYLYDASGQRVKKVVRRQGGQVNTTTSIEGVFEHHKVDNIENNHVHIMDDQQRVAIRRVGPSSATDSTPAVQYLISDHVNSSIYVADENGNLASREEFYPYGDTSFGSVAKKRYRFTGKERDEESGLNYHGARYYAPALARWINPDPIGSEDEVNLFTYVSNNPMGFLDNNGKDKTPAKSNTLKSDAIYRSTKTTKRQERKLRRERRQRGVKKRNLSITVRGVDKSPLQSGVLQANGQSYLVFFNYKLTIAFKDKKGEKVSVAVNGLISDGKIVVDDVYTTQNVTLKLDVHAEAYHNDASGRKAVTDLFHDEQDVSFIGNRPDIKLELLPEIKTHTRSETEHSSTTDQDAINPQLGADTKVLKFGLSKTKSHSATKGESVNVSATKTEALTTFMWFQIVKGEQGLPKGVRIDVDPKY